MSKSLAVLTLVAIAAVANSQTDSQKQKNGVGNGAGAKATKCAQDYMTTQKCGEGCEMTTVQGQQVCTMNMQAGMAQVAGAAAAKEGGAGGALAEQMLNNMASNPAMTALVKKCVALTDCNADADCQRAEYSGGCTPTGKATLKVATAAGGAALALEPSAGKVALKKAEVEAQENAQKSTEEDIARIEKEIVEKKCAEKDTETLAECEDLTKENTKYHESLSAVLSELMMLKAELKKAEAEKADADAAASKTNAEAEKKEAPTMGNSNSNMANSGDVQTAMQGAGSPASSDDGNPFAMLGQFGMKPADIGDYGAEFGDKCKGFNMFLKGEKMTQTCQGLDTESACTADKTCEWDSRDCGVSGQAVMDAMGLKIDQEAVTAEITAAGADMEKIKAVIKKNMAKLLPIMNDRNATMKTITEYNAKCQGKAKDACKGVDVCEVKLNSQYVGGGQYKMAEECEVDQDKAVKTLKCSGLTKMLADNDAMKTKNVAAKAKKTLESKKTKLTAAKKAVEDYKKANPDAKAETDTQLKALVATQTTADASVKTASTQADTADTAAKAAEQKAADTADDSSALRALPSVMAVVAATVAAAFA